MSASDDGKEVAVPTTDGDTKLFVRSMMREFISLSKTCDKLSGICATFLGEGYISVYKPPAPEAAEGGKKRRRKKGDPNEEKKPYKMSGYQLWAAEKRQEYKDSAADIKGKEIMARLGQEWKDVSDQDKETWKEKALAMPPVMPKSNASAAIVEANAANRALLELEEGGTAPKAVSFAAPEGLEIEKKKKKKRKSSIDETTGAPVDTDKKKKKKKKKKDTEGGAGNPPAVLPSSEE